MNLVFRKCTRMWCKRNKALNKHTKLFMAEKDGSSWTDWYRWGIMCNKACFSLTGINVY